MPEGDSDLLVFDYKIFSPQLEFRHGLKQPQPVSNICTQHCASQPVFAGGVLTDEGWDQRSREENVRVRIRSYDYSFALGRVQIFDNAYSVIGFRHCARIFQWNH